MRRYSIKRLIRDNSITGLWSKITNLFSLNSIFNANNFDKVDESILIIFSSFLKLYPQPQRIIQYLESIFPNHLKGELRNIYLKHLNIGSTIYGPCKILLKKPTKIKLYVIYTLFDISSKDNIYSIDEEDFIMETSDLLKIPRNTYHIIKKSYIKQGLQEERKIIEEQNRKKLSESFLPYYAYKVLGVSPTVTKVQLKKIYRRLAKKYHPDKYHGQNEEVIHQAEDKFQEITKAYEIIVKHMKQ